jgi:flagellar biosynthesis GTPase FlhF
MCERAADEKRQPPSSSSAGVSGAFLQMAKFFRDCIARRKGAAAEQLQRSGFNDAPCPPFTSHGASVSQPIDDGAGRGGEGLASGPPRALDDSTQQGGGFLRAAMSADSEEEDAQEEEDEQKEEDEQEKEEDKEEEEEGRKYEGGLSDERDAAAAAAAEATEEVPAGRFILESVQIG